ncbi:DNA repair protein RAD57 [Hypoxylon sp. FL1857]|nr:DNA repair protein RAD57 [Hypoxylon sp. FL1857]
MTDLSRILPDFPIGRYAHLLPTIEKHGLTTADLLTLQVPDIGKRTQLPLLDIKRLCNAVLEALHVDLGISDKQPQDDEEQAKRSPGVLRQTGAQLLANPGQFISTLDDELDRTLGGGVPAGYITEITGESGAGKTQFLLTLLLACQLLPPRGLGRPALYISTEAPLSTRRLSQLLTHNPYFRTLSPSERPSLDQIIGTVTPDLESQDHILSFQVPVEVSRRNIGLLVLDSVAANYRAEFERNASSGSGSNLAARTTELVRLGQTLHDLARKHGLAVVVANQVADRFAGSAFKNSSSTPYPPPPFSLPRVSQESPLAKRSRGPMMAPPPLSGMEPPSSNTADILASVRSSMPEPPPEEPPPPPALLLDHQQRWFTGWGDEYPYRSVSLSISEQDLKTPSLGLVWSTQIAARLALFKKPVYGRKEVLEDEEGETTTTLRNWRRWMKVVFAPHVPGTGPGLEGAVEFEVTMGGIHAVDRGARRKEKAKRKGKDVDI